MKIRKVFLFIVILINAFCLSSCDDYLDIHEMCFVASMGFDYNIETNEYHMYLYILNNLNVTNSQNIPMDPEVLGFIAEGYGNTINDSFEMLKNNSDLVIDLHHIKTLILHESFFVNKNLHKLFDILRYSLHFDPTFEIYVTDSPLKNVYSIQNMSEVTSFYTLLTGVKQGSQFKTATYYDLCNDLLIENYSGMCPLITVVNDVFSKEKENYPTLAHTGYAILNDNLEINILKLKQIPEIVFAFPISDYTIELDKTVISINHYKVRKKLKNNTLTITIIGEMKILRELTYDEEWDSKIKNFFDEKILKLKQVCDTNDIDVFNINYLAYQKRIKPKKDYYKNIKIETKYIINTY